MSTSPLAESSSYARLRDLPLVVDRYRLHGLELAVSRSFLRRTTLVELAGAGASGTGEDVTYDGDEQSLQQARGPVLPLAGTWTLETFSRHLGMLPLFEREPAQAAYLDYRRWGFESAALDLALEQTGLSLGEALGREARPLRFVASTNLGEPPAAARVRAWLDLYPELRFKLDATPEWTDDLVAELAASGAVDTVDFKGQYRGTTVDKPADADLYRRVAEGLPEVWLEDPALTPETVAVLEPHRHRVTWDAVIHSVADIEALRWPPRTINVKPSRFGSLERLLAAYDYCESRGIGVYGGGQFELGVGRDQIQLLAALFHPSAPNDVAPRDYNLGPAAGLPPSPLALTPAASGFRLAP